MALIIQQQFPLGRFHATRWNQGAFGDAYGEWPPSPWRLLRALAARWFQYARETGSTEVQIRDTLLQLLANALPTFSLPCSTWRGPALKQYQPTNIDWTDKSKSAAAYKKPQTTLVEDNYRAVAPDESIFWYWEYLKLEESQIRLLDILLERIQYFGRAESFCRLRRTEILPDTISINCHLAEHDTGDRVPVLVPLPGRSLDLDALFAATDDKELRGRSIPPGTAWYYASLPRPPQTTRPMLRRQRYPQHLNCIQFAMGGRVFPPVRRWVKITERFRGRVIWHLAMALDPESRGRYDLLAPEHRQQLALICGKDSEGQYLYGHRHAFFLLLPDVEGLPTRLVAWRREAFSEEEITAFLAASERPISWDDGAPEWQMRLVPLPFETPPPHGLSGASQVWKSVTPFVPPAERHRFRKNGRARPGEAPAQILTKLLQQEGKPVPDCILPLEGYEETPWVVLHQTRGRRLLKEETSTPWVRPGFYWHVKFHKALSGPLILGDSCHFGLGLFMPA
ncbi:MAG: type I-U CRISPR-associated protein Csb2 [Candidatus Tectimicrobiota bacterium]